MPINRQETIAEIKEHIQKFGGDWCVGTANSARICTALVSAIPGTLSSSAKRSVSSGS